MLSRTSRQAREQPEGSKATAAARLLAVRWEGAAFEQPCSFSRKHGAHGRCVLAVPGGPTLLRPSVALCPPSLPGCSPPRQPHQGVPQHPAGARQGLFPARKGKHTAPWRPPYFGALPSPIYSQVQLQPPGLGRSHRDQPLPGSPSLRPCPPVPPRPFPRRGLRPRVPAGKVTQTRAGRLHWSVNGGSVFAFITNPLKTGWLSPGQDRARRAADPQPLAASGERNHSSPYPGGVLSGRSRGESGFPVSLPPGAHG